MLLYKQMANYHFFFNHRFFQGVYTLKMRNDSPIEAIQNDDNDNDIFNKECRRPIS